MSLVKISDAEKNQKGVTLLPNVPPITASQLKQKFEEKSDDLIIPKFNELSDQLMDADGAAELGAKFGVEDTSVQGAIDSLISLSNGKQDSATAVTHTATEAVGASNKGVYVDADGVATAMTYEVNASVPANAVFTDHVYTAGNNITIEDGVISATGGGGGGTSDYPDLTNKPKINSVELVGNKTLTELGIPTALSQLAEDSTHQTVTSYQKASWNDKTTVAVDRHLSTGTKIATVTVDGTATDLYAPAGGGGGSVNNAYKNIKVGTTTITASGEDTFEIKAGSNVTLSPDASTKSVTINASGGGSSTGDMLMSDYDSNGTVKTNGGIEAYVKATSCSQGLLEETVGFAGRNLLPNKAQNTTIDYVTFTVNADKSVDLFGSSTSPDTYIVLDTLQVPTGSYILSTGVPYITNYDGKFGISVYTVSGDTRVLVDEVWYGEKTFSLSDQYEYEFRVYVKEDETLSGHETVYPMLRLASDPDDTYMPYKENVVDRIAKKQDKLTAGTNISIETVAGQTVISASGGGTYDSLPEAQGGTDKSLVLTGDKYTWNRKQEALTFDDTPTSGGNNPVKSGGIYTALSGKQDSSTAVTHTASTAVGSATKGVYIASNGQATAMTYELNKTVPSDALFTDHTYTSKTAASGGTAESLCTTGEKYTWNSKVSSVSIGNQSADNSIAQHISYSLGSGSTILSTPISGSRYMEQSTHTVDSQTGEYIFTFVSGYIYTSNVYDFYADVYGVAPSSVSVSSGSMVVKFAAADSVSTVRVYIR